MSLAKKDLTKKISNQLSCQTVVILSVNNVSPSCLRPQEKKWMSLSAVWTNPVEDKFQKLTQHYFWRIIKFYNWFLIQIQAKQEVSKMPLTQSHLSTALAIMISPLNIFVNSVPSQFASSASSMSTMAMSLFKSKRWQVVWNRMYLTCKKWF